MELIDYVRMLGRRWQVWVSLLLVGTLAGTLYVVTAEKTYSATAEAFVASTLQSPSGQRDARTLVLDSMASYSALIDSPSVIDGVLEDVPTNLTPGQLASRLSAVHIARTVVLRISATSSKPQLAAALSNAAAKRLAAAIVNLETAIPGGASSVRVVITKPATPPRNPSKPNKVLGIALGMLAGLGLGLVVASLRDQYLRTMPAVPAPVPTGPSPHDHAAEPDYVPLAAEPDGSGGHVHTVYEDDLSDAESDFAQQPQPQPLTDPLSDVSGHAASGKGAGGHPTERPYVNLTPSPSPSPGTEPPAGPASFGP
jgi:capsular polysaccharide biosynthesis protein